MASPDSVSRTASDADIVLDEDGVQVLRITADNPGPLTAKGTNSYVILGSKTAIVDPGPESEAHLANLTSALKGRALDAIVATHPHLDHTAAVGALAELTGAPVFGAAKWGELLSPTMTRLATEEEAALGGGEGGDPSYAPDRVLNHGELLFNDQDGVDLRAIATPGHTSTHLSFALEVQGADLGVVFSGDHVMGWATSIVSPPDGDMAAFMRSLSRLAKRQDRLFLPGHGDEIRAPTERLAELKEHRLMRRAAIERALEAGPRTAPQIRETVYADLAPFLARAADRNVLAHLIELMEEGEAELLDPISPAARFALVRRRG